MEKHTELISILEAARRLGLRPVTIRQWAAARKCARVKLGRRVLIPASEIDRLIEAATIPALPDRQTR
jgi:excisionase family DNA binding protein